MRYMIDLSYTEGVRHSAKRIAPTNPALTYRIKENILQFWPCTELTLYLLISKYFSLNRRQIAKCIKQDAAHRSDNIGNVPRF
jgi:hypothetical protein